MIDEFMFIKYCTTINYHIWNNSVDISLCLFQQLLVRFRRMNKLSYLEYGT